MEGEDGLKQKSQREKILPWGNSGKRKVVEMRRRRGVNLEDNYATREPGLSRKKSVWGREKRSGKDSHARTICVH